MSASMRFFKQYKLKTVFECVSKRYKYTTTLGRPKAKYFGRAGSPNKLQEIELDGEEFRMLVIPGHTKMPREERRVTTSRYPGLIPPPRCKSMKVEKDWTNVWPTAQAFKWSVVPFPVRMGVARGQENEGIPPGKYANAELMKIPNFLHLTPPHIKLHCKAIKEFCTEWPAGLETEDDIEAHFPLEVITREYVRDAPTHRDVRGRVVTLKVKLSSLELDYHARDKLLRLVKDRYDPETDILTLRSDRCPLRKQNYDYTQYLFTALYYESWKFEEWESEKEVADMEKYVWEINPSKEAITTTIQSMAKIKSDLTEELGDAPAYLETITEAKDNDDIISTDYVQDYKSSVESLHNDGEDLYALNRYKDTVKSLLLPQITKTVYRPEQPQT